MKKQFFSSIRDEFFNGKLTQGVVDTVNAIEASMDKFCINNYEQRAYIFGTAYHESYSSKSNPEWLPVREGFAKTNQGAINAVTALYNKKKISVNYALPQKNGLSYYGRGYVQITHPGNYDRCGKRLGIPLYSNPDLALTRSVAADILVVGMKEGIFTGKKLDTYINDLKTDYKAARYIVNGVDQKDRIAGYAERFYESLILA